MGASPQRFTINTASASYRKLLVSLSSIVVMLGIRRQGEHPNFKDWLKDGS
jgi:hypothetical protein